MRNLEACYQRVVHWADRDGESGCLVSRYSVGSHGYAQAWDGETVVLCHRVVWIYNNGPLDSGVTVDHLCHQRKCIEITHLRTLSNLENARRNGPGDWPLGSCKNGHENRFWRPKGERRQKGYCSECRRKS